MEIIEDIRCLPPIDEDCIHIWGLHVPDHLDRLGDLYAVLSNREREKADRYRLEADRHASIFARGALRMLLSGYTGLLVHEIAFTYTENGKPHLIPAAASQSAVGQHHRDVSDTISFNVSHSGEWVVLALGRNREIGVDIERIKRNLDIESIASRYYTPKERAVMEQSDDPLSAFFQLWACKEAYIKACGSTLFTEIRRISVPVDDGAEKDGWFFHTVQAGSRYAAAVVTNKPLVRMSCYDFGGLKWEN